MVTALLVEEVEVVESEVVVDRETTFAWCYSVPCAGVKYYSYQRAWSPADGLGMVLPLGIFDSVRGGYWDWLLEA